MDVVEIKKVVNDTKISDDIKEKLILQILAKDKNVLSSLLILLAEERNNQKEIILDLNLEVSRYNIHINNLNLLKNNRKFLNQETKKLYEKWSCLKLCFNNKFQ